MLVRRLSSLASVGTGVFLIAFLLLAVESVRSVSPAEAQTRDGQDQQALPSNVNTCLSCHNNPTVTSIFQSSHGDSAIPGSPMGLSGCASCHGESSEHASAMQPPSVVFGEGGRIFSPSDVQIQNQSCLNCHESQETVHWTASVHESADLSCASCHTIHATQTAAIEQLRDASVCLSCHLEQRSQLNRRTHHPISEGLMSCNDCHNPHGSDAVALMSRTTVNETCTTCHTEKRGPFLWEHQPVSEDCTTCHNPHGSTQLSMLSVRQPFLCQTCHSDAFHPSSLYSATGIPPNGAQQNLLGDSCTNCHSTVHGSNHPSGSRLTR